MASSDMISCERARSDWTTIPRPRVAVAGLIAAGEAICVWLGFVLGDGAFEISPFWPAAGFGIAVVTVFGYGTVPLLMVAATPLHIAQGLPWGASVWLVGNIGLSAALGAWLLRTRVPNFGASDAGAREALLFLLLAGIAASGASAVVGVGSLLLTDQLPASAVAATMGTWWLGDAMGVVTVAPVMLAALTPIRRRWARDAPAHFAILLLATAAITGGAFLFWQLPSASGWNLHWEFAGYAFVIWGAVRFGVLGSAATTAILALGLVVAGAAGYGPYGGGTPVQVHNLQILLGTMAASGLVLGVTVSRADYLHRYARGEADFIQSIAGNIPGAVFRRHLDPQGILTYPYVAGRFADEFGLASDNMTHRVGADAPGPAPEGLRRVMAGDLEQMNERLEASARTLEPVEMELRYVRDSGDIRWVRSISRPHRSGDGGVIWDGVLLDVTEEKRQRAEAEYLARHDPLTGLLNRSGIKEALAPALSRATRNGHYVAVWLIDLDGFKEVNDTFGHAGGDAVLCALADRMREVLRLEDIKGRLGGDEFLVIQSDVQDRAGVITACNRVVEAIARPVEHEGRIIRPGVSVGVAFSPCDGETEDALFAAADHAMYVAKGRTRGQVVFYSPEIETQERGRKELVRELSEAIDARALAVHYQPQIDLTTGDVSGLEALVRWQHPTRGSVSPGTFVPLAEECGLVSALDLLVLETVLGDMADWRDGGGPDMPVAINLSGASLRDPANRDRLARTIRESGIDTGRLELEITETTLIHAADERVSEGLRALAGLGVRFAADDFGTGYGSLTYLRALPITRIKIDRSFVHGAPHRSEDAEIVRALLQLARNLGLQIIAEGVETDLELNTLYEMGCTQVQGFYFARPMDRAAIASYVNERRTASVESSIIALPPF